jgi:aldehyde:ferredoxin oxidoreductase
MSHTGADSKRIEGGEKIDMPHGYVGKFLNISLESGEIETLNTMEYSLGYVGGRGIAAKIAWEELPEHIDAFDPENRLIIMTGPLTGTLAPTSGRTAFCSISPRVYPTPWYTHSTMGGFFGSELKYAGFDGMVIYGRAENPVYIWINNGDVKIASAKDLWGLRVRSTVSVLRKMHGEDVQIACIGPAGERLVRYSAICHPPEAASGHSGFGAVMGSKNLKAIVVKGSGSVDISDPEGFLKTCNYAMKMSYTGTADSFIRSQTSPIGPICSHSCKVDCRVGRIFPDVAPQLSSEAIKAHQTFCIGNCWANHGPYAGYEGMDIKVPQVTGWNPEDGGVELHRLCDDLGLDLWLIAVFQPWFVRCAELGIKKLGDLDLRPRDPHWFYELLIKIAFREGVGDMLAEDLRRMVDILNKRGNLPKELLRLGEELEFAYGFPAHREGRIWDPEPMPFWVMSALMYATESRDPAIGTHTSLFHLANLYLDDSESFIPKMKRVAKRLWGSEKALDPDFDHKAKIAIWCQHRHILIDSLLLCDFAFPRVIRPFKTKEEWLQTEDVYGDLDIEAKLLSACTGTALSTADLERACERIFNLERMILISKFDRDRRVDEQIEPHFELPCKTDGTRLDIQIFKELLDEYYVLRGWDVETGAPSNEKLKDLGLAQPIS